MLLHRTLNSKMAAVFTFQPLIHSGNTRTVQQNSQHSAMLQTVQNKCKPFAEMYIQEDCINDQTAAMSSTCHLFQLSDSLDAHMQHPTWEDPTLGTSQIWLAHILTRGASLTNRPHNLTQNLPVTLQWLDISHPSYYHIYYRLTHHFYAHAQAHGPSSADKAGWQSACQSIYICGSEYQAGRSAVNHCT